MPVREFLQIVKESSLGTVMASPVAGTDSIYIRLTDSNSFSMKADPIFEEIPWGGGLATTGEVVSDHYGVKGNLKTKLYPSQVPLLLGMGMTRINTGQTAPWTTTENAGDLASVSIYHGIMRSNGTIRRKRYAGVKAAGVGIDVSRQSATAMLNLDLLACRSYGNAMDGTADPDATEFPAPADTDYPTGPYTFKQSSGHLSISGAPVVGYSDLAIKFQNVLDGQWLENSYLTINQFLGRKSTLDATLLYKASPDRRAQYEGVTALACTVGLFTGQTGQDLTIQFNGKNRISALDYDLAIDKAYFEKLSLLNVYSASAAEDCSFTLA